MLPHLEVMLQNSVGATLLVRRHAHDQPVEGIVLAVDRGVHALLFDVPADWPRTITLDCELYCDGGVLAFSVPAVRLGTREIEFPKPQEMQLLKQRDTARVPVDLAVELRGIEQETATGTPTANHRVVDISGGGVALATDIPLQVDQQFAIYFPLPEWKYLGELSVRVAHVIRPGLYGLTFQKLTPRQRTRLYGLVAARLRAHRQKRREEARRWLK